MDIKAKLKEYGITLREFSVQLKISRPTLNAYIKAYDSGEEIPNPKYQQAFENLFNDDVSDKDRFLFIIDKYHHLLERDEYLGIKEFDIEKTNLLASITRHMQKDMAKKDFDNDIYTFINMIVTSYREEEIFKHFAHYFLYLNAVKPLENMTEVEKVFISNCFRLMSLARNNELEIDKESFNEFKYRVEEVKMIHNKKSRTKRKDKEEAIKTFLKERLEEKVKEQIRLGVDIDEIDFDALIDDIDLNEAKVSR